MNDIDTFSNSKVSNTPELEPTGLGFTIEQAKNGAFFLKKKETEVAVLDDALKQASLEVINALFLQYNPSGTAIPVASTVLECRAMLLRLAISETEMKMQEMQGQVIEMYGMRTLETLRLYVLALETVLANLTLKLSAQERQLLEDYILSTIILRQII